MSEQTIALELTVQEARALTRSAELLIDCFGPEVRSELGVGPGETVVEIAALKVEHAIERQEILAGTGPWWAKVDADFDALDAQ